MFEELNNRKLEDLDYQELVELQKAWIKQAMPILAQANRVTMLHGNHEMQSYRNGLIIAHKLVKVVIVECEKTYLTGEECYMTTVNIQVYVNSLRVANVKMQYLDKNPGQALLPYQIDTACHFVRPIKNTDWTIELQALIDYFDQIALDQQCQQQEQQRKAIINLLTTGEF